MTPFTQALKARPLAVVGRTFSEYVIVIVIVCESLLKLRTSLTDDDLDMNTLKTLSYSSLFHARQIRKSIS